MHEQLSEWEDNKAAPAPDRRGAWLGPVSCPSPLQQQCRGHAAPGPFVGPCHGCELSGLGNWPWLAATPLPSCLTPRTGEETGERGRKLIGWIIDREITYQVLLGAKKTQLREFNLLFWGKSLQTLTYLSSKFPRVNSLQDLLCCFVTTARDSQSLSEAGDSQKLCGVGVVPGTKWLLCAAPSFSLPSSALTLFLHGLQPLLWEYLHWHGSFPESHYYVQV